MIRSPLPQFAATGDARPAARVEGPSAGSEEDRAFHRNSLLVQLFENRLRIVCKKTKKEDRVNPNP